MIGTRFRAQKDVDLEPVYTLEKMFMNQGSDDVNASEASDGHILASEDKSVSQSEKLGLTRERLVEEQMMDSEQWVLANRVLMEEEEVTKVSFCYFKKDGVLMRK